MLRLLFVLCAALLLSACNEPPDPADDPSFAADVQPVFTASCVQCHGPDVQHGSYRLDSHAEVMETGSDTVPNVIAGRADSSATYRRIRDGEMPPAGPLPGAKQEIVRNWINKGAKDN